MSMGDEVWEIGSSHDASKRSYIAAQFIPLGAAH